MSEMEAPIRTPFPSWDGLEEDELADIKSSIRDIENVKVDITKKQEMKKSSQSQEKKLQDEVSRLLSITREWARRPRPTTDQQASLSDQDRVKYRKLYVLIQEGLQNPVKALDEDFVNQLRDLCQVTEEIGATDAYEIEEAAYDSSEDGEPIDVRNERERIREEGVFSEECLSLVMKLISSIASRIEFSPPPFFHEVEDFEEEPVKAKMQELFISNESKAVLESDEEEEEEEEAEEDVDENDELFEP